MNINSNYNFYLYSAQSPKKAQSFGAAKDITLKYIFENRLRLLPQRMRNKTAMLVSKGKEVSLRELHLKTYAPLLECETLGKAQNLFPEFREVLQANAVIKKGSKNTRAIAENVPLEELSLHILKERWGNLKTLDELAKELGVKDRNALGWVLEKIQMPDLGKNYQALLKASDEALNNAISQKLKAYHRAHPEFIVSHNRAIAKDPNFIKMNSDLSAEAWSRVPHIRKALSDLSAETSSRIRFSEFWGRYPEYAEEFGRIKKEVAAELRAVAEKSK